DPGDPSTELRQSRGVLALAAAILEHALSGAARPQEVLPEARPPVDDRVVLVDGLPANLVGVLLVVERLFPQLPGVHHWLWPPPPPPPPTGGGGACPRWRETGRCA